MKKFETTGPGLLIAIPTLGRPVPLEWALAFKSLTPPINFNINFSIINGKEVGNARNIFAEQAIKLGAKYLFFIGDDVEIPAHALRQLIFRMENVDALDVVGGVYCSKSDPPAPLVFKGDGVGSYWDWKIGEFFQCTGMGMDCTLIRTSVFEKMSKPWFKTVDEDQYLDGVNSAEAWTEDLYFFKKLRTELPDSLVYCDASIICRHWDVYNNKSYTLPPNSFPTRQKMVDQSKRCLMLGQKIELTDETFAIVRCVNDNDPTADYRLDFNSLPFEKEEFDWVVVTNQMDYWNSKGIREWLRVSRSKVSILLDEIINKDPLIKLIKIEFNIDATFDGNYVELIKV